MTTSHKTNWREARMKIQEEKEKMKLPEGRTCNHCAHIDHCKWLFGISGEETECDIYPSRFYDDVMTIYHRDGSKTEVVHPFDAMQKCEVHTVDKDQQISDLETVVEHLQNVLSEWKGVARQLADELCEANSKILPTSWEDASENSLAWITYCNLRDRDEA